MKQNVALIAFFSIFFSITAPVVLYAKPTQEITAEQEKAMQERMEAMEEEFARMQAEYDFAGQEEAYEQKLSELEKERREQQFKAQMREMTPLASVPIPYLSKKLRLKGRAGREYDPGLAIGLYRQDIRNLAIEGLTAALRFYFYKEFTQERVKHVKKMVLEDINTFVQLVEKVGEVEDQKKTATKKRRFGLPKFSLPSFDFIKRMGKPAGDDPVADLKRYIKDKHSMMGLNIFKHPARAQLLAFFIGQQLIEALQRATRKVPAHVIDNAVPALKSAVVDYAMVKGKAKIDAEAEILIDRIGIGGMFSQLDKQVDKVNAFFTDPLPDEFFGDTRLRGKKYEDFASYISNTAEKLKDLVPLVADTLSKARQFVTQPEVFASIKDNILKLVEELKARAGTLDAALGDIVPELSMLNGYLDKARDHVNKYADKSKEILQKKLKNSRGYLKVLQPALDVLVQTKDELLPLLENLMTLEVIDDPSRSIATLYESLKNLTFDLLQVRILPAAIDTTMNALRASRWGKDTRLQDIKPYAEWGQQGAKAAAFAKVASKRSPLQLSVTTVVRTALFPESAFSEFAGLAGSAIKSVVRSTTGKEIGSPVKKFKEKIQERVSQTTRKIYEASDIPGIGHALKAYDWAREHGLVSFTKRVLIFGLTFKVLDTLRTRQWIDYVMRNRKILRTLVNDYKTARSGGESKYTLEQATERLEDFVTRGQRLSQQSMIGFITGSPFMSWAGMVKKQMSSVTKKVMLVAAVPVALTALALFIRLQMKK